MDPSFSDYSEISRVCVQLLNKAVPLRILGFSMTDSERTCYKNYKTENLQLFCDPI